MSMNFEVFPTKKNIPKCNEIIKYSMQLFREFMHREKLIYDIEITTREVSVDKKVLKGTNDLVSKENHYTVFNINEEGEVYVFYHKLTELDNDFWNEELKENKNAQIMKGKIYRNLELGYSWSVKRTMGQPAVVSLYYGYLAIAIAVLTDGIIYSDDGAWDYLCLPIEGSTFADEYLNLDMISDYTVKENIKSWLYELGR